jgi:hypothetical protein
VKVTLRVQVTLGVIAAPVQKSLVTAKSAEFTSFMARPLTCRSEVPVFLIVTLRGVLGVFTVVSGKFTVLLGWRLAAGAEDTALGETCTKLATEGTPWDIRKSM